MHTVFALLCFVVVIHWLIFPYPSGLLHWHCGNLTIAPVPVKQPWWIWINTSCEFIMNDCITTTKQSTTKPCAYFLGYTVYVLFRGASKLNHHYRGLSNDLSPMRRQTLSSTNDDLFVTNLTLRTKLPWNSSQNTNIYTQENAFKNVVSKLAVILFRPQCVNPITFTPLSPCQSQRDIPVCWNIRPYEFWRRTLCVYLPVPHWGSRHQRSDGSKTTSHSTCYRTDTASCLTVR